jgi:hypothetical protein
LYTTYVTLHNLQVCAGYDKYILLIRLISHDDFVLVVEKAIPHELLVKCVQSFSCIPRLDWHILKHLQWYPTYVTLHNLQLLADNDRFFTSYAPFLVTHDGFVLVIEKAISVPVEGV